MNCHEGPEFYLCCKTLISSAAEQQFDHLIMILLCRHVQRCESILRLDINGSTVLNKNIDYFRLASCKYINIVSCNVYESSRYSDIFYAVGMAVYLMTLYAMQYFLSSLPRRLSLPFSRARLLSQRDHPSRLNARHLSRSIITQNIAIIVTDLNCSR